MIARYTVAGLAGLLTAAAMLWLMQSLLTSPRISVPAPESGGLVEFVRLKRETRLQLKERIPPPPTKPEPLPRPTLDLDADIKPLAPQLDMTIDLNVPLSLGDEPYLGPISTQMDRGFVPLARHPPQYPQKAARRGVEGWVKVSFRVTESGTVEDVVVLESEPPGVFEKAATQAVSRWRFKPRMVNGRATAGKAEQVVEFKLNQRP